MSVPINTLLLSILNQYHEKHDLRDVPVLVDHLRPMIQERGFADRIIWEAYDAHARNIAAQVAFYHGSLGVYAGSGDYARIQYSNSLNYCWQRFVICKEMYHCILDKDHESRVTNITDLLKLAEYLVDDTISTLEEFPPHSTEQDAEILALETLFPLELRKHYLADHTAGKISDLQLALRYRIPQYYARLAMYPNYYRIIDRMRGSDLVQI